MDKEKYIVWDKTTEKIISPEFETQNEAEIWIEENGIDYDYFEIMEVNKYGLNNQLTRSNEQKGVRWEIQI